MKSKHSLLAVVVCGALASAGFILGAAKPPAQDPPKATIKISSEKKDALDGWPVGHIATPVGWGFGITVKVKASTPIKDWKIRQEIFQLVAARDAKGKFVTAQVKDKTRPKMTTISEAAFDDLKKDYAGSTWADPKVTFAPDGPYYVNDANENKGWIERGNDVVRYWDAPGQVGTVNGVKFNKGMDATALKGYTVHQIFWVRVSAESGTATEKAQFAASFFYKSDGATWK